MKAILISGYHYNESVRVVDVKETEKSYMVEGKRFVKGLESDDLLSSGRNGSDTWASPVALYKIDSKYALNKIESIKQHVFCQKVIKHVHSKGVDFNQAKAIAEILGL